MRPKIVYFIPWGGLGDILLTTPALASIHACYPEALIYCVNDPFYFDLLCRNPHIHDFIPPNYINTRIGEGEKLERTLNNLSLAETVFFPNYGNRRPSILPHPNHAIKYICNMIKLEPLEYKAGIYLTDEDTAWAEKMIAQLGERVISFHPKAACCRNKEWYPERWAEVVAWLKSKGFVAAQLGLAGEPAIEGAVHLMGQTSIHQALALIKYSHGFMGVDSVFNHAAHSFDKPSVVLFGASTPAVWGYPESINIYKGLKCQPCIDLLSDKCPARYCMQRITTEDVIQALLQQFGNLHRI